MFCPKCNRQLSATAVFCPACGNKIVRENNEGYTQNSYKGENNNLSEMQHKAAPPTNGQEYNEIQNNYDYNEQNYRPYDYLNKQVSEKEQYKSGEQWNTPRVDNTDYSNFNSYKEIEYKLEDNLEINNEEVFSNKSKKKKILIVTIIAVMAICLAAIVYILIEIGVFSSTDKDSYEDGISLMNSGKYTEAIAEFEKLNDYKDSESKIEECNKAMKYEDALSLMKSSKYTEAIAEFEELGEYNDSIKKITECVAAQYKNVEISDYIQFGNYEQDNDKSNGKEKIEWLVIDKQENKILVISKFALDCAPYNDEEKNITWEECSLRSWLNNDFINSAFSANEKYVIQSTKVINEDGTYNTDGGNDTTDNIFLLSISETEKYFASEQDRICNPTAYVSEKISDSNDREDDTCWWWLRSPGRYKNYASGVNYIGSINEFGDVVYNDTYSVRPALWITLKP